MTGFAAVNIFSVVFASSGVMRANAHDLGKQMDDRHSPL